MQVGPQRQQALWKGKWFPSLTKNYVIPIQSILLPVFKISGRF